MTVFKMIKAGFLILLGSVLFGCASGDSPSGTQSEVQEVQTQLLGDMPLPQGAKIVGAESIIIGGGDQWVGRAVIGALQGATDVYAFFQSEYPKAGWNTVSAVKAKTSILVFTKGDRTATIEVSDGPFSGPKTIIVITSSPKNANVISPTKR